MSLADDKRLLVEIASLYYEQGLKQEEIAKRVNISRSLVSKYLVRSREEGIVEITIHDEYASPYRALEEQLQEKFGLEDVICIESAGRGLQNKLLGIAAAKYLARIIKPWYTISVSAGTTVHEAAANFPKQSQMTNVSFVPLVGGMGMEHITIQSTRVCELFASRCGGHAVDLHAPITVDEPEAKPVFMKQSFIKNVFDEGESADIALVGIGGIPIYSTLTDAYLSDQVNVDSEYSQDKIAGDICYNFINHSGQLADCSWNKRVLAIDLERLKKVPRKIAVSGGKEKVEGIRAALKGNLVDVLITDEKTARDLVEQ
ncbi:sugar-binding transcriptional regulator [Enterococcus sp. 669A]|uniref:Sugar-binding transcriptional regulator n=1 Tax=Candidatus Enterococcus moelleringii TaxID=2815325 RepID=A0ABS3LGW3_9ENTE|nr:sugar-binding transcriptional regulator [Enterococcus sp. 669A]MBO1308877.1 sugar-binding transcriptional regulator [Enterococcus sp. 669A]